MPCSQIKKTLPSFVPLHVQRKYRNGGVDSNGVSHLLSPSSFSAWLPPASTFSTAFFSSIYYPASHLVICSLPSSQHRHSSGSVRSSIVMLSKPSSTRPQPWTYLSC